MPKVLFKLIGEAAPRGFEPRLPDPESGVLPVTPRGSFVKNIIKRGLKFKFCSFNHFFVFLFRLFSEKFVKQMKGGKFEAHISAT